MFGRIVRRYDLMNRLMTGGRDVAWRRRAVGLALSDEDGNAPLLDVATGTGDLALELARAVKGERLVVGVDFAAPMVRAAAAKEVARRGGRFSTRPVRGGRRGGVEGAASSAPADADAASNRSRSAGGGEATAGAGPRVVWAVGDALALPFADGTFAACTVGFGLRNMADYEAALREMGRVLRPGGRLVCLELTPFRRPVLGALFAWYFARVVPFVGGVLSGDREAYSYLPRSVAAFPTADALRDLMTHVGFTGVSYRTLGGGTVALHVGIRNSADGGGGQSSAGRPQVAERAPPLTSRTQRPA